MNTEDAASTIVVSHGSALRALRHERMRYAHVRWEPLSETEQKAVLAATVPQARAIDEAGLMRCGALDADAPLDALVGAPEHRRRGAGIAYHVTTGHLPEGSLLRAAPGIYVASPALAIVQAAASTRSLAATLATIIELCGAFSMPEALGAGSATGVPVRMGMTPTRASLTETPRYAASEVALTVADLRRYLVELAGAAGSKLARAAVRYALDGARSPMEAITACLFHAPFSVGGFGVSRLQLNERITFDEIARAASGLPYAVCDAYVPDAKTTLEYNGTDHDTHEQRLHDERRAAGLAALGITTIALNDRQLRDIEALEAIARTLYQRMGKRYRNRTTGRGVKQIELLNGLRVAYGLRPC